MEQKGTEGKTPLPPTDKPEPDSPVPVSDSDRFGKQKKGSACANQDAGFLIGEMKRKLKAPQAFVTIHDHIVAAMESGVTTQSITEAIADESNIGKDVWDVLKPLKKRREKMSRGTSQAKRVMEKLNAATR